MKKKKQHTPTVHLRQLITILHHLVKIISLFTYHQVIYYLCNFSSLNGLKKKTVAEHLFPSFS